MRAGLSLRIILIFNKIMGSPGIKQSFDPENSMLKEKYSEKLQQAKN
jgi:hypothetical protein